MWQAYVDGVLGLWLIVAAFLNFSAVGNLWDNLIVGVIVAIAGFMMISKKSWQGWTEGILGIWLVVAAFIPSLQAHIGNLWNDLIVGVIVAVVGFTAIGKAKS